MTTYRMDRCPKVHRTFAAIARCLFGTRASIKGEGQFAVLAHCGHLTVTLWPTQAEAQDALAFIDQTGCGGRCYRRHEVTTIHQSDKAGAPTVASSPTTTACPTCHAKPGERCQTVAGRTMGATHRSRA